MRIISNESCGLIIDIQERLLPHIHENEKMVKNTEILINGLKALKIPIIITEQYTKGLGFTVQPIKEITSEFKYLEKSSFSCIDDNVILKHIHNYGCKNVIIAGMESHVCVMQTAVDLISAGYQPIIVEDAVSSRTPENKAIAIERMRSEGAIITTYESLLFELCRFSTDEAFRTISKLVK